MITRAFLVGYGIYTRCCQKGRQYLGMLWLYENLWIVFSYFRQCYRIDVQRWRNIMEENKGRRHFSHAYKAKPSKAIFDQLGNWGQMRNYSIRIPTQSHTVHRPSSIGPTYGGTCDVGPYLSPYTWIMDGRLLFPFPFPFPSSHVIRHELIGLGKSKSLSSSPRAVRVLSKKKQVFSLPIWSSPLVTLSHIVFKNGIFPLPISSPTVWYHLDPSSTVTNHSTHTIHYQNTRVWVNSSSI